MSTIQSADGDIWTAISGLITNRPPFMSTTNVESTDAVFINPTSEFMWTTEKLPYSSSFSPTSAEPVDKEDEDDEHAPTVLPWSAENEEENSNSTAETDNDQDRLPSGTLIFNQTASPQCGQPSDRYPTNLRVVDNQLLRETTVGSAFISIQF
jgi:hypothetical protein